jgi:hypothetical protein
MCTHNAHKNPKNPTKIPLRIRILGFFLEIKILKIRLYPPWTTDKHQRNITKNKPRICVSGTENPKPPDTKLEHITNTHTKAQDVYGSTHIGVINSVLNSVKNYCAGWDSS